jgi:N-acetylmuramoyl-L-alanine amidase
VVIDAGHGGKDPGNLGTGRYKTREKDIALAVALKVGRYIQENFSDVRVLYTRSTDVFVELEERAQIANRASADLFISIHCDAFTKSSVQGSTSIVMGKDHDDDNMRIAQKENSVIFLEDNYEEKYQGFDPNKPESYIALTLYQNAFMQQSISFAQKVQDQFRERVQRRDRGVKQQPLMVTKMAVMPAVLVELGFLTNPTEEDFLNSEKGQDYMASAIYRAFKEYKVEREAFVLDKPKPEPPKTTPVEPQKSNNAATEQKTAAVPDAKKDPPTSEPMEENAVYYAVQISTSARKFELKPENFKGVEGVSFYESSGFYKYTVGQSQNLAEIEALKIELRKKGFKDSFVVALSNGKRISLEEAKALLP